MVEPTIPEMLRVGLKAVQERWEKPEERFRVNWPDDLEGQGLCIMQLGNFARSPDVPWNVRVWAFDTLQAAAAQYNTNNNPSAIPTQMHTWALWVSSGAVERPKRPRSLSEKQCSKRYTSLVECKNANYSTTKSRLL